MIKLLQGFSIAKGLVFGHSQKKRDKPINPKPVLIDNNADINQNIRSTKYFPLLPELSGLQWLPHWSYNLVVFSCIFVFFIFFLGLRYFFVFFCLAKLFENLVCFNNG